MLTQYMMYSKFTELFMLIIAFTHCFASFLHNHQSEVINSYWNTKQNQNHRRTIQNSLRNYIYYLCSYPAFVDSEKVSDQISRQISKLVIN